jgi:hypothetical protein
MTEDQHKKIQERAYEIWEYRESVGIPNTPEENWFDAEREFFSEE